MLGKLITEITSTYKVDDIKKINNNDNKFYQLLISLINKNYFK